MMKKFELSRVSYFEISSLDEKIDQIQDNLINVLNPVFNTQTLGGTLLKNVPLVIGQNKINHLLGRNLVGWQIVRQRSAASFYDNQDNNTTPNKTLLLISSAVVVCDIYCF